MVELITSADKIVNKFLPNLQFNPEQQLNKFRERFYNVRNTCQHFQYSYDSVKDFCSKKQADPNSETSHQVLKTLLTKTYESWNGKFGVKRTSAYLKDLKRQAQTIVKDPKNPKLKQTELDLRIKADKDRYTSTGNSEQYAKLIDLLEYFKDNVEYLKDVEMGTYLIRKIYREELNLFTAKCARRKPIKGPADDAQIYLAENILNREFKGQPINNFWSTDYTEFRIRGNKKVYLCLVKDIACGSILGYSVTESCDSEHAVEALLMGVRNAGNCAPKCLHSDRGTHFTSGVYQQALKRLGIQRSMSSPGKCPDNGPTESAFSRIKDEYLDSLVKCKTLADVKREMNTWMLLHNHDRIRKDGTYPNQVRQALKAKLYFKYNKVDSEIIDNWHKPKVSTEGAPLL